MTDEETIRAEILAANELFYRALSQADMAAMAALWQHSPMTECIHPGWDRIRGWAEIEASWSQIFQNQGPMPVQTSHPMVDWRGNVAWVTCYENIVVQEGASLQVSQMLATNVFERVEGRWQMVIHHASPAPPAITRPRTWQTSLN
jgi:ketosteroid isomerase-like protein